MQQIVAANFACTRIATLTPETYIKAVNKCQLLPHSQQKRVQWGENRYHYIQFRRKDEKGAVLSCPPRQRKKGREEAYYVREHFSQKFIEPEVEWRFRQWNAATMRRIQDKEPLRPQFCPKAPVMCLLHVCTASVDQDFATLSLLLLGKSYFSEISKSKSENGRRWVLHRFRLPILALLIHMKAESVSVILGGWNFIGCHQKASFIAWSSTSRRCPEAT